jgi:hypothetical protein
MNQSQKFAPRPPQSGLSDRPGPCPSSLKASAAFNHAQMYDARRAGQPVWGCERHAPGRVDWDSVVILTRARCDRKPPVLTLPVNLGRRFGVGSLFPSISFGCSLADAYRSNSHLPGRLAERRHCHFKSSSFEAAANYARGVHGYLEAGARSEDELDAAYDAFERQFAVGRWTVEHLRKNKAKTCDVSVFAKLKGAYIALCERQVAKLQHQIAVEKAIDDDDDLSDLEAEASRLAAKVQAKKAALRLARSHNGGDK